MGGWAGSDLKTGRRNPPGPAPAVPAITPPAPARPTARHALVCDASPLSVLHKQVHLTHAALVHLNLAVRHAAGAGQEHARVGRPPISLPAPPARPRAACARLPLRCIHGCTPPGCMAARRHGGPRPSPQVNVLEGAEEVVEQALAVAAAQRHHAVRRRRLIVHAHLHLCSGSGGGGGGGEEGMVRAWHGGA